MILSSCRTHVFLLIVGPCSIHDTAACRSYAEKLAGLAEEVKDKILVVMRVYFEKTRTTVGWKGLIMDPDLDGSDDIPKGLEKAREFLTEILSLGLPHRNRNSSTPSLRNILRTSFPGPPSAPAPAKARPTAKWLPGYPCP